MIRGRAFMIVLFAMALRAEGAGGRVLMLTKSTSYQHDVVARGANNSLGVAEQVLVDLGKRHGFSVVVTKDGRSINADTLSKFQALFFFSQGDPTVVGVDGWPAVRNEDRSAIVNFVRTGGGLVAAHCGGTDTFHEWTNGERKPFIDLVGAEFLSHGTQQSARIQVIDKSFPAFKDFPRQFTYFEEWYAFERFQKNIHILAMIRTSGMQEPMYQRPDYPIAWCSNYGRGRVFYVGWGHLASTWQDPKYQDMIASATRWALKLIPGDATPNLKKIYGSVRAGYVRINTTHR